MSGYPSFIPNLIQGADAVISAVHFNIPAATLLGAVKKAGVDRLLLMGGAARLNTADGMLMVGEWAAYSIPVLTIHGISRPPLLWQWTAAAAPDVRLVAPDLRGRGSSVDVPGPYGLLRHPAAVL